VLALEPFVQLRHVGLAQPPEFDQRSPSQ
jgi:hypothetical protein